jgi:hypothetical protein
MIIIILMSRELVSARLNVEVSPFLELRAHKILCIEVASNQRPSHHRPEGVWWTHPAFGNQKLNKTHPAGSSGNCRLCFLFEKNRWQS